MDRYKLSKHDSMYPLFMAKLRDAIFFSCEDDYRHNMAVAKKRVDPNTKVPTGHIVSNQRVRRMIPGPEILESGVGNVVSLFRDADASFATDALMDRHKSCLKHIKNGCLTDHPEVPLYFELNDTNKEGLYKKLKTARGSSQQECFHRFIYSLFTGKTFSPELFDAIMIQAVYRWNVDRGITAKIYNKFAFYNIGLLQKIQTLYSANTRLFHSNPLEGYCSLPYYGEGALEKFGCSRAAVTNDEPDEDADR